MRQRMLFSLTTSQNLLWKLRVKDDSFETFGSHQNPHVMKELVTGSTSLIKVSVMKDGYFLLIWVKFSNSTREMYANVESNQNEIHSVEKR